MHLTFLLMCALVFLVVVINGAPATQRPVARGTSVPGIDARDKARASLCGKQKYLYDQRIFICENGRLIFIGEDVSTLETTEPPYIQDVATHTSHEEDTTEEMPEAEWVEEVTIDDESVVEYGTTDGEEWVEEDIGNGNEDDDWREAQTDPTEATTQEPDSVENTTEDPSDLAIQEPDLVNNTTEETDSDEITTEEPEPETTTTPPSGKPQATTRPVASSKPKPTLTTPRGDDEEGTVYYGLDSVGHDLKKLETIATTQECVRKCKEHPQCVAVSHYERGGECWLKYAMSQLTPGDRTTVQVRSTIPGPANVCNGQLFDFKSYICADNHVGGKQLCPQTAPLACNIACYNTAKRLQCTDGRLGPA